MRTTKHTVIELDLGDEIVIRCGHGDKPHYIEMTLGFNQREDDGPALTVRTDDVVWMRGWPEGVQDDPGATGVTLLAEGDFTMDVV